MYTTDFIADQEIKKKVFTKTQKELAHPDKNDTHSILFPEVETNLEERLRHMFQLNFASLTFPNKFIYEAAKRLFDISLCIILAPIALILIGIFGLLVKLESEGPVIYSQTRSGKNAITFTIYKLRSMINDAEKNTGAKWAEKNDPRVTAIGKIIRKTRIDELPQLWNILKGEMTFIGPRPERPELLLEFSKANPTFILRNSIKPGITGWAQINGGYELSPSEKIKYDLFYIKKRGLAFDSFIVIKTFGIVFSGEGAY